jgi:hypothetical protein
VFVFAAWAPALFAGMWYVPCAMCYMLQLQHGICKHRQDNTSAKFTMAVGKRSQFGSWVMLKTPGLGSPCQSAARPMEERALHLLSEWRRTPRSLHQETT